MTDDVMTKQEAAELLASMTPEDMLDMQRFMAASEQNLPEAPVSVNFRGTTTNGYDFMFTLRDWDEIRLLGRVIKFAIEVEKRIGLSPPGGNSRGSQYSPQQDATPSNDEVRLTSQVDASVIEAPSVEMYAVTSLEYGFAGKTPRLKVRGGRYTKWGYSAYPEVIPEDVDYGSWEIGKELTAIPANMKYAYVDKEKKKIVAFAA